MASKKLKFGIQNGLNVARAGYTEDQILTACMLADKTGYDSIFYLDHTNVPQWKNATVLDPWVMLSAIAAVTQNVELGTCVTDAIMNDKPENYPYGSMLSGMGFGNCSTTLGHALSYVFSNEGVPHGYSLSSCTTVAHKHNNSIFYDRFKEAMDKLGFDKLELKADVSDAADTVMTDRGHLDPNPIPISKDDVVRCLEDIKAGNL